MDDWLKDIADYWFWLSIGLGLGALEMVLPGFFLMWLAGAAVITALLAWALPIGMAVQVVIFALLSIVIVLLARRYFAANPIETDDPNLNIRGARYIGEVIPLVAPIENGRGRAKLGDGVWPVRGPDAPLGAMVRVVSADGGALVVEPA